MKKIFVILFMFFLVGGINTPVATSQVSEQTQVYVCTGAYAKRYHKRSSCRGLNACKGDIVKTTVSKATQNGRTKCGYCY